MAIYAVALLMLLIFISANEILLAITGRAGSNGTTTAIRELTILKFDTQSGAITTSVFLRTLA
jgi:hypothetical protein